MLEEQLVVELKYLCCGGDHGGEGQLQQLDMVRVRILYKDELGVNWGFYTKSAFHSEKKF